MKKKIQEIYQEIKFQLAIAWKNIKKYFQKNFWKWITFGLLGLLKKVITKWKKETETDPPTSEIIA